MALPLPLVGGGLLTGMAAAKPGGGPGQEMKLMWMWMALPLHIDHRALPSLLSLPDLSLSDLSLPDLSLSALSLSDLERPLLL